MTVMPIHEFLPALGTLQECHLLMEVPDIPGDATMQEYKGWIPVDAVSGTWVLANDTAGTGSGRQRRRIDTPGRIVLRLPMGAAGIHLVGAAVRGRSFPRVRLHHVVAGESVHVPLRQEFDNVVVVAARSDAVAALPMLQLEMAYEEAGMVWTDIDPDGSSGEEHEVSWDVTAGV